MSLPTGFWQLSRHSHPLPGMAGTPCRSALGSTACCQMHEPEPQPSSLFLAAACSAAGLQLGRCHCGAVMCTSRTHPACVVGACLMSVHVCYASAAGLLQGHASDEAQHAHV